MIVRMNWAMTAGYENDVGSRTDIRVAWDTGFAMAKQRHEVDKSTTAIFTCATDTRACGWYSKGSYDGFKAGLVVANGFVCLRL